MTLRIVPMRSAVANAFVAEWHRHHKPPVGQLFALGVAADDLLVGVAIVGRPVARHLDDGLTVEVTRVATNGHRNACSILYGACWRSARSRGYLRALTYTRDDETGASLRAAGWLHAISLAARPGWNMPGRPRDNGGYDMIGRHRWCIGTWVWVDGTLTPDRRLRYPTATARPPVETAVGAQLDLFEPSGGAA